jgi:hypothetical protein
MFKILRSIAGIESIKCAYQSILALFCAYAFWNISKYTIFFNLNYYELSSSLAHIFIVVCIVFALLGLVFGAWLGSVLHDKIVCNNKYRCSVNDQETGSTEQTKKLEKKNIRNF